MHDVVSTCPPLMNLNRQKVDNKASLGGTIIGGGEPLQMNMTLDGAYLSKKKEKILTSKLGTHDQGKEKHPHSRRHNLNNDIIFNLFVASPSPTNCTGAKQTRLQAHSN